MNLLSKWQVKEESERGRGREQVLCNHLGLSVLSRFHRQFKCWCMVNGEHCAQQLNWGKEREELPGWLRRRVNECN
mgnify:CR=1 FL=1